MGQPPQPIDIPTQNAATIGTGTGWAGPQVCDSFEVLTAEVSAILCSV
jgi:hypothetical protein